MPARDTYHEAVVHALEKEGWQITHDPLVLIFRGINLILDLGAERVIALERGDERIAVEIKTFERVSALNEFHSALGQFFNYRLGLRLRQPERKLFLAVPASIFASFFQLEFVQLALTEAQIALLVYDPDAEVIVQWQQF